MDSIWAPWRMEYILGEKEKGCIFCNKPKENEDEKNLILKKGSYCFIILNKYPYNNGHLLVSPYRHVSDLILLNEEELSEMMKLTQESLNVFNKTIHPSGYNIGINLGKVGGAGIADHVHLHVVPRWEGDTNFMPVIASTKIIPQHLKDIYAILKEGWKNHLV